MSDEVQKILLYEVRELRKELKSHREQSNGRHLETQERFSTMDKKIYSNRLKLGTFVSSITILVTVISKAIINKFFS